MAMAESQSQLTESVNMPHLQVFLRMRPLVGAEKEHGDKPVQFEIEGNQSGFKVAIAGNSEKSEDDVVGPKKPLSPRSKVAARMKKRRKKTEHLFSSVSFSGVLTEEKNNEQVFNASCAPLVDYAIAGNTSLIFAYGNTGSGKTHTILGYGKERGMYYQAAQKLCQIVQEINRNDPEMGAVVKVQFGELYLDRAYDLLDGRAKSFLRETEDGFFNFRRDGAKDKDATGLATKFCTDISEIEQHVKDGVENRLSGNSTFHTQSSRSHAVLEMEILSKELRDIQRKIEEAYWWYVLAANKDTKSLPKILHVTCDARQILKCECMFKMTHRKFTSGYFSWANEKSGTLKFVGFHAAFKYIYEQFKAYYAQRVREVKHMGAKVILCDLAGSEHGRNESRDIKQTAQEKREGRKINLSLMTLNEVFRQKALGKKPKYRESTLTKALRDSFEDESSRCLMISNLSSSQEHKPQTLSTLNYAAQMAKCS